jgi:hypothetical protein
MKKFILGLALANSAIAVGEQDALSSNQQSAQSPQSPQSPQSNVQLSVRSLIGDAALFDRAFNLCEGSENSAYSSHNNMRAGFKLQVMLEDAFNFMPLYFNEEFSNYFAKLVSI